MLPMRRTHPLVEPLTLFVEGSMLRELMGGSLGAGPEEDRNRSCLSARCLGEGLGVGADGVVKEGILGAGEGDDGVLPLQLSLSETGRPLGLSSALG